MTNATKTRVVVVHVGRSGSRLLGDLLNQHHQITWHGEIYRQLFQSWDAQGLDYYDPGLMADPIDLLRSHVASTTTPIVGFEVKFFHLDRLNISIADYFDRLIALGFDHVIILKRKNLLRKIVSSLVAQERRQYHQAANTPAVLTPITINLEAITIDRQRPPLSLQQFIERYEWQFSQLNHYLKNQSHNLSFLDLSYEDDIQNDPLISYQKSCEFVNISPGFPDITYGKTNPFPLQDIIQNYDQVLHYLANTPYAWMIST